TQDQVPHKRGKNRTTITNMLRLLGLRPPIQHALKTNAITTGHARSLVSVEDPRVQDKLLKKAIENDLSVRQMEEAVRKLDQNKKRVSNKLLREKDYKDLHLMELSSRLRKMFSTRVQIKKKNKGGEIRLEYYSDDDLDRIISLLESVEE
ncbi:MAG: ParB/RepB/Spo0J family partition protein, partial [Bacteroidota bacterium]